MANSVDMQPGWLTERRKQAATAVTAVEIPDRRTPGWEFMDISGLDIASYGPVEGGDIGVLDRSEPIFRAGGGSTRLAQVDGQLRDFQMPANFDGSEPIICPLSVAAEHAPELLKRYLGSVVKGDSDPFVVRNEATWQGGAFVYVPAGVKLEGPVLLDVVQQQRAELGWRTLVVLEAGAEAEIWEQYLSASDQTEAVFNSVIELVVGENANLRFIGGQSLSEKTWIFSSQRAVVGRNAMLDWVALGFGSRGGKVRMETTLEGEGSTGKVTGAYLTANRQQLDFDTLQEHCAPNTISDLAFRGVLGDRSTAVWRGMIKVDPGAQKTDAFQECRNLLLSRKAHADAIPGLEIEANDVRCTHAAAVARINDEQLYYLNSRGVSDEEAKQLVVEGFMQELVERFDEGPVRQALSGALDRRLLELQS